jgi:FG-GAP repeat
MNIYSVPAMSAMSLWRTGLAWLLLVIGVIHSACADTWVPGPPTYYFGTAGIHLGASVAIGRYDIADNSVLGSLYVGTPMQSAGNVAEAGAVQVYTPNPHGGWVYSSTKFATNPQAGAHFGASLAYSAGHLIVAAPGYNSGAGAVEFFNDNESAPPAPLVSEGQTTSVGATAVAADGDLAAIGNSKASNSNGVAYVYQRNGSGQWHIVNGNAIASGGAGGALGASVAIRKTSATTFILVAGAPAETQNSHALAGAVHVYIENAQGSGLADIGPLVEPDPAFLDVFGASVAIDAGFIYVGATGRDNGVGRVGSVTIFKPASLIGYDYLGEYFPGTPPTIGGHCGASLSVDPFDSEFIVGCPGGTGTVSGEGTASVFRKFLFLGQPVWLESVLSFGNMLHGADALGTSVAIYGDHAFAGAPDANFPPPQTGNGRWMEFLPDNIFKDGFGG